MALTALEKRVVEFYLGSHDFNGLPVNTFEARLREEIAASVGRRTIDIVFSHPHPNPHIKSHHSLAPAEQIQCLEETFKSKALFCLYPAPELLATHLDREIYKDKPFSLELALGAPQLENRYFETWVLEQYRNDPRFDYRCDDLSGRISISSEAIASGAVQARDQTFLQQFGFAYSDDWQRAVAAYLRYLHDFTPEHQQLWKQRELSGRFNLHPDYYRASILGKFPEGIYIYRKLFYEMRTANELFSRVGLPRFFKKDFVEDPPNNFAILLRPTQRSFDDFAGLLDKVLSDNINADFFPDDISRETIEKRKDGVSVAIPKGTISMLAEWLNRFEFDEPVAPKMLIDSLRKIRKVRSAGHGHTINDDKHDIEFYSKQRELIKSAYQAVGIIRDIGTFYPENCDYEIPAILGRRTWTR